MRRVVLLLVLATLVPAAPAAAHQLPAGCAANGAAITLFRSLAVARPADAQTYSIFASNDAPLACTVTDARVDIHFPGPTGAPSVTGTMITSEQTLPGGTPDQKVADVPYAVAVNAGVTSAVARVVATGIVHDSPADRPAMITKEIATEVTQPALSLDFTATPATGFAPLNFTFNYVLTNTGSTPVALSSVAIAHPSCTPITRSGGDTNGNGLLESPEIWRYACPGGFALPGSLKTAAIASARSEVDTFPVSSQERELTITAERPPRPVLTLTRGVTPSGPAPLTVTYTYAVRNDSGPDSRAVKDVFIDHPGCPGATRTSPADDLLQRGETWSFSCVRTLATAQTVAGTAIAKGVDDLEGIAVASNEVGAEVTATLVTPAPTATATPTPQEPTADPLPTPRPSARVNFATASGRISRCRTKTATAQLKVGSRLIASKRIKLDSRCRYKVRFTSVTRTKLRGATRVTVTVRAGRRTATHRLNVPRR